MGAAMKPCPELLERYELVGSELAEFPINWERVFGRSAPLAVEIGYGGGEYLCWWAQQQPGWDFVGIELPQDCVLRAVPQFCLLYTSPSPRDRTRSRMPSSA